MKRTHELSPRFLEIPGLRIRLPQPRWFISLPLVGALIASVSLLDLAFGPEPEFSIFYLVPITSAVFLLGRTAGVITSLLCAGAWLWADVLAGEVYSGLVALLWDDIVQLLFFLLHTLVMSWLLRTLAEVRTLSLHDSLTGAANWRYFEEYARTQFRLADRNRTPLTFAYMDVDNFKRVNDSLGHETGNEVLRTVADTIRGEIRPNDMLVRLGGDEFGLLLADSGHEDIRAVLQRIVAGITDGVKLRNWPVSLSVGAVTFHRPPDSLSRMVNEADEIMYQVKQSGKNNIRLVERSPGDPSA